MEKKSSIHHIHLKLIIACLQSDEAINLRTISMTVYVDYIGQKHCYMKFVFKRSQTLEIPL